MSDTDQKQRLAEKISDQTGVDVGPEYIEVEGDRAVLTDEGAEYIALQRDDTHTFWGPIAEWADMEPTAFRAFAGYLFASMLGTYAIYALATSGVAYAVGPAGIALLGLSIGRYYQTAERV